MLRELTKYYRPKDIREVLMLLNNSRVKTVPLAGGTELLGRKDATIEAVVDLQDIGLDYIRSQSDGVHVGAMTRLQTMVTDTTVRNIANELVSSCAMKSARYTERIAATLGGTIAAAPSWHDLLPALLVLDSEVVLQTLDKQMRVPLESVLSDRRTYLTNATLIAEIILPLQPAGAKVAYHRVSRTPADRAIVCVAVRGVKEGIGLSNVRVAVGGVSESAMRLPVVENEIRPDALVDRYEIGNFDLMARLWVRPPSDHIASSEYRQGMIGVLLRRALMEVAGIEVEG